MDIPINYQWAQERGGMLLGTHLRKQQVTMTMMMLMMMLMMTRLSKGSLGSPEDDDKADSLNSSNYNCAIWPTTFVNSESCASVVS